MIYFVLTVLSLSACGSQLSVKTVSYESKQALELFFLTIESFEQAVLPACEFLATEIPMLNFFLTVIGLFLRQLTWHFYFLSRPTVLDHLVDDPCLDFFFNFTLQT